MPKLDPHLVACPECSLYAIRPDAEDAEQIKEQHDSGDCPGEAYTEPRYSDYGN